VDALVDISQRVFSHLKPTPKKAHYTFCWRDLRKIAISLEMVEGNSLKNEENVMSLFYHECLRTYGDRLLMSHDNQWFLGNLEEVCRKHFNVVTNEQIQAHNKSITEKSLQNEQQEYDHAKRLSNYLQEIGKFQWPIKDPKNVFYSHWNNEVEGFYMQVDKIEDIDSVIERNLSRFNDSNERVRLDLMLYNQLSRQMLKMLRVITAPNGHLVHIALKGFGLSSAVKLVAFTAGHTLR
jgi:dynein heavy chain